MAAPSTSSPAPWDRAAALARWPVKLGEELLLAPWTLARLRRAITELPERLDVLSAVLAQAMGMLDATLPSVSSTMDGVASNAANLDTAVTGLAGDLTAFRQALEELLPELARVVGGMEDRVGRVERVVVELGDVLTTVIGAIPGVRRALREPRPPAPAPSPER